MGLFGRKRNNTVDFTKMSDARIPPVNKDYKFEGDAVDLRGERVSISSDSGDVANPFSGVSQESNSSSSGREVFGFLDSSSSPSTTNEPQRNIVNEVSEISELKTNMRKISGQIEDSSNEVYRLMQRIELLEKKIERLEGR